MTRFVALLLTLVAFGARVTPTDVRPAAFGGAPGNDTLGDGLFAIINQLLLFDIKTFRVFPHNEQINV